MSHIPLLNPSEFIAKNYNQFNVATTSNLHLDSFEIHKIEDHKNLIKFPIAPHRKTVYDFLILTQGQVHRTINNDLYQLQSQDICFLPILNITSTSYVSPDARGFYLHFTESILSTAERRNEIYKLSESFSLQYSLLTVDFQPIVNILERLLHCHTSKQAALVAAYLDIFILEINEYISKSQFLKKSSNYATITTRFKSLVNTNILQIQSVKEYAKMLHISANHLNKCIKTTTSQTAQEYIFNLLILEAKILLKNSNLSIAEIAYKMPQNNVSDFSRFFKNKTGLTPKQFRDLD